MSVKLNSSGGGSVTLQEPVTASNFTLTLPAQTANVITDSSAILNIGSGQVYKDASGNVGIGTSSPAVKLDVVGTSRYTFGVSNSYTIQTSLNAAGSAFADDYKNATQHIWQTSGTERMRIDSSGNVGIGVQSPNARLELAKTSGVTLRLNDLTTNYWDITNNSNLIFNRGGTEYARIDSSGTFLVGKTTGVNDVTTVGAFISAGGKTVLTTTGVNQPLVLAKNASTSGGLVDFFYNGSTVGSVTTNGSSVTYNTTSDYRLKQDVQPLTSGLATISALKPYTYKWKLDNSDGEGFIAHELAEVIPLAITGEKDAVNEDGSIKPQGVDYSKIVVHLVAAIQEQQAQITELKAEIASLKGTV